MGGCVWGANRGTDPAQSSYHESRNAANGKQRNMTGGMAPSAPRFRYQRARDAGRDLAEQNAIADGCLTADVTCGMSLAEV